MSGTAGGGRTALAALGTCCGPTVSRRERGERYAEAYALSHIAEVHRERGLHDAAATGHRRALELFRSIGDRAGEAEVLNRLGLHEAALTLST